MKDLRHNDLIRCVFVDFRLITVSPTLPQNLSAIWLKSWNPDDFAHFSIQWQVEKMVAMATYEDRSKFQNMENNLE